MSRAPIRAEALKPGLIVEALDVAQLWFPAKILLTSATGARVHYIGWPARWDDDIRTEDFATHICEFRGWGYSVPGDYYLGDAIEALDLTGTWVRARVLAVAEAKVKVHYLGWTSKWDEWIDRSTGRLRPLAAVAADAAAPPRVGPARAKPNRGRRRAAHDLVFNDEICSVCHQVGELVRCKGACLRSFHAGCLEPLLRAAGAPALVADGEATCTAQSHPTLEPVPVNEALLEDIPGGGRAPAAPAVGGPALVHERSAWVCPGCTHDRHQCALCGQHDATAEPFKPPRKCARAQCGKHFHRSCLASAWAQFGPTCEASAAARDLGECPAHVCWECGAAEDGRYGNAMAVCVGCGCALHRSCIAPASGVFESITLGHGHCADCATSRALLAQPCADQGAAAADAPLARASGDVERARGLAAFRFALVPLDESASDESDDEGRRKRPSSKQVRLESELSNLALRETARATSEVGFPWQPLRFRKRTPLAFELPDDIVAELKGGLCDAKAGFRPPAFSVLQRCIWRTGRTERLRRLELELCVCAATGLSCADGCLNRGTHHECCADSCSVGDSECQNRSIQRGLVPPISVFKTHSKGWGVRADEPILCGQFVIEYVGEVIDTEEWKARDAQASQHEAIYSMHLSNNLIIDARSKGNNSRWINHSCSPNIQVQKWFVNSTPRLAMFALRDIAAFEELGYDYNVHWSGKWKSGQRCQCGAPNCTGNMSATNARKRDGPKPKPKPKKRRAARSPRKSAIPLAIPEAQPPADDVVRPLTEPCEAAPCQDADADTDLFDASDGEEDVLPQPLPLPLPEGLPSGLASRFPMSR